MVSKRMPILPEPERPTLSPISIEELTKVDEPLRTKILLRDQQLKKYSKKLEASVSIYNDYARKTNDESKLFDSIKDID